MTLSGKAAKVEAAPALFRLLSDSALSRGALGACGFPLAILEATAQHRPVTYVNGAFEAFFGYDSAQAVGRSLAALILRGDEALGHRLLAQPASRWNLRAWSRDGTLRHVEVALGAVRDAGGQVTHWVAAFHDRGELERLRAELESLRALAAVS